MLHACFAAHSPHLDLCARGGVIFLPPLGLAISRHAMAFIGLPPLGATRQGGVSLISQPTHHQSPHHQKETLRRCNLFARAPPLACLLLWLVLGFASSWVIRVYCTLLFLAQVEEKPSRAIIRGSSSHLVSGFSFLSTHSRSIRWPLAFIPPTRHVFL